MSLWLAVFLGAVVALSLGTSGILTYILVSLSRAAPLLEARSGRPRLMISMGGLEPRQMRLAVASPHSRRHPRSRWAGAHF